MTMNCFVLIVFYRGMGLWIATNHFSSAREIFLTLSKQPAMSEALLPSGHGLALDCLDACVQ